MSMNNYDNFDDTFEEESEAPEESSNRTFLIAAGGLGLLVLIALLCLGAYVIFNFNSGQTGEATAQAMVTFQEATVQSALTQTAIVQKAQAETQQAVATVTSTSTPVIAEATATYTETPNPATATVGAAFTQIAVSTQTIIPTSTALPNTGFADEVGLPGMFAMAVVLIVVIFLVRRLRATPAM